MNELAEPPEIAAEEVLVIESKFADVVANIPDVSVKLLNNEIGVLKIIVLFPTVPVLVMISLLNAVVLPLIVCETDPLKLRVSLLCVKVPLFVQLPPTLI